MRWQPFKRTVQTITYLPHFISIVVICGMIIDFPSRDGRGQPHHRSRCAAGSAIPFCSSRSWFRPIYVASEHLADGGLGLDHLPGGPLGHRPGALRGGDASTAPGGCARSGTSRCRASLPTIMILLILRIGQMMNVGFEKIILLYNPTHLRDGRRDLARSSTARGCWIRDYSFCTAVGLVQLGHQLRAPGRGQPLSRDAPTRRASGRRGTDGLLPQQRRRDASLTRSTRVLLIVLCIVTLYPFCLRAAGLGQRASGAG